LTDTTKDAVRAFLREFKSLIKSRDFHALDYRYENDQGLIDLFITKKIRKQELKLLNVLNYSSGPYPDHDQPGNIWVFGKEVRGTEVYLKLKISERPYGNKAICISFHPAERPLIYPFCPERNNPEL